MAGPIGLQRVTCPLQLNENAIPIIWHDIQGDVQVFRQLLATLRHRDIAIAPFLVSGIPVTPYKNPITNLTSHHIIRMFDSQPSPRATHTCVLDLLICDDNTYFAAFRRIRFTLEEFQVFRAGGGGGQGGTWFCLQDSNVPAFLNATRIGVSSSYVHAAPGGQPVFLNIFKSLCKFEREDGGPGPVTPEVRIVCCNVMVMYCEVRRLRSLLIMVNYRVFRSSQPNPMEKVFWDLIHCWSDLSTILLEDLRDGMLAPANVTRKWCSQRLGFHTTESLIHPWFGELLKVKFSTRHVGMTEEQFNQFWLLSGGNFDEPGFVQQL